MPVTCRSVEAIAGLWRRDPGALRAASAGPRQRWRTGGGTCGTQTATTAFLGGSERTHVGAASEACTTMSRRTAWLVSVERRAAYVALLETDCLLPERRRGNHSSGLMSAAIRRCAPAAMMGIPRRHKGCSHSLVGAPPPRPERRLGAQGKQHPRSRRRAHIVHSRAAQQVTRLSGSASRRGRTCSWCVCGSGRMPAGRRW